MEDYYDVLGVDEEASQKEIKEAYRKKAKKYHPDSKEGNEDKFKKINKAHSVLGDEENRRKYDRKRKYGSGPDGFGFEDGWQKGGPSFDDFAQEFGQGFSGGGINIEELFNEFGSQRRGRRHRSGFHGGSQPRRNLELILDFEESLTETTKQVRIGRDIEEIKIPAGVPPGWSKQLDNQKNMHVVVNVQDPQNYYKRQGHDLYKKIKMNALRALTGVKIRLENVYGEKIQVNVPPQTSPGELFVVSDEGINFKNRTGNLYLKIEYSMPTLNEDELSELREFTKKVVNKNKQNKKDFNLDNE